MSETQLTNGALDPAVLRQMLAHESNVLFIGRGGYQGVGATFEQVRKIFGASSIRIMLLADVNGEQNTTNGGA